MTAHALNIRPYSRADRSRILSIWLSASRIGHPFLSDDVLASHYALVRDVYLANAEIWTAEHDGIPVGFIGYPEDGFIGALFVDPAQQGRGIGRALIRHAILLKGNLHVEVYAANDKAHSFYTSCGFMDTARRDHDGEGRPFPIIHMFRNSSRARKADTTEVPDPVAQDRRAEKMMTRHHYQLNS